MVGGMIRFFLSLAIAFLVVATIMIGVAKIMNPEDPCVKWADYAVKSVSSEYNIEDHPSYVFNLFERGEIKDIPAGWSDFSRGCCIDRLDYLVFSYPKKIWGNRNWNEVRVSASWIQCEEYDGKNFYQWPPVIEIRKDCYYCNDRNGWYANIKD